MAHPLGRFKEFENVKEVFWSRSHMGNEKIVDSGLCAEPRLVWWQFARDLGNLTLARSFVKRHQKSGKGVAEWALSQNVCWFAQTIVKVKATYGLSVDMRKAVELPATVGHDATETLPQLQHFRAQQSWTTTS